MSCRAVLGVPLRSTKHAVLDAIGAAVRRLPLAVVLKILRLPASRYHAWRRAAATCGLDDRSACPRMSPQQFSAVEAAAITSEGTLTAAGRLKSRPDGSGPAGAKSSLNSLYA